MGMMQIGNCLSQFHKKHKIKTENLGDKLVVTVSGKKEDIVRLEEKLKAIRTLSSDCCVSEDCCK